MMVRQYSHIKYLQNGRFKIYGIPPTPTTPNFENYSYPCGTPKFQFIFVKRDAESVEMII